MSVINIIKNISGLYISPNEFGKLIGVSGRRVNQLIADGVLIRSPNGKLNVETQVLRCFLHLKSQKSSEEEAADIDLHKEKTLHEAAKRQIAELKLDKMKAKIHEAKDVEMVLTDMLVNLRTQLLGLPTALTPILFGKSREDIYKILTENVEMRLAEISDYKPEMFNIDELEEDDEPDTDG